METIPPEVKSGIILMPDETIRGCWEASMCEYRGMFQGYIIATNKKLIFVEMKGIFSKQYLTKDSTNWEDIQSISVGGLMNRNISIMKQSQGRLHEQTFFLFRHVEVYSFKNLLESCIRDRFSEIEKEKQKSRIQYVIDFSFLKAEMTKGGITLTTVKCPSCGANVDLPETGNSFQCKYCNSTIHAQDIFSKIKGFIEGL